MKKGQLINWDMEIQKMQQVGSVMVLFNKGRISDFYKEHGIRLDGIYKAIENIRKEYCVYENDSIKIEGEGSDRMPVLLEGKTREDFNKAIDDLMNQDITNIIMSKV